MPRIRPLRTMNVFGFGTPLLTGKLKSVPSQVIVRIYDTTEAPERISKTFAEFRRRLLSEKGSAMWGVLSAEADSELTRIMCAMQRLNEADRGNRYRRTCDQPKSLPMGKCPSTLTMEISFDVDSGVNSNFDPTPVPCCI